MSWKCPLNDDPNCTQLHAINTADGCLKHYNTKSYDLVALKWKRVDWPTRSYYWEEDKNHPSYKEKGTIDLGDVNILNVEIL